MYFHLLALVKSARKILTSSHAFWGICHLSFHFSENMVLSDNEIKENSKIITERGEALHKELLKHIKTSDHIVRTTPLMSYVYASLKMIEDTYKTYVDITPQKDFEYELNNLSENIKILIDNVRNHQRKLLNGTSIWDTLEHDK